MTNDAHGSALDRVSAFQIGFSGNPDQCAAINSNEIAKRQGDLPKFLNSDPYGSTSPDSPITADTLADLMTTLREVYSPTNPPSLSTDPADCADARPTPPVSYCPSTNTVGINLVMLQAAGASRSESDDGVLLQGDNTALSMVTSRYALALQRERGLPLQSPTTALRTACLTGVAQRKMAEPGHPLVLSAGDTDEAISGLLTNGLVASDVNGTTAPAGFTRILAYRAGLQGDADQCYQRFL